VGDKHDSYSSVQLSQNIEEALLRVVINTCNGFIQQEQAEQEDKVTVQKSYLSDLHEYLVITREDFTVVFMALADRGEC